MDGEDDPLQPAARVEVAPDLLDLDPGGLVERKAADTGAERDQGEALGAELVRLGERAGGGPADDLPRGRPAELHGRGVDHPAGGHLARRSSRPPRRARSGRARRSRPGRSGPPAREIAPATPPPCRSWVLAALAIASTSSFVMSACCTSISATSAAEATVASCEGARSEAESNPFDGARSPAAAHCAHHGALRARRGARAGDRRELGPGRASTSAPSPAPWSRSASSGRSRRSATPSTSSPSPRCQPCTLLGLFTFVRTVENGVEDLMMGRAINRIRNYYLQVAGEQARYFMLSANDDADGVIRNMGVSLERRQQFFTTGSDDRCDQQRRRRRRSGDRGRRLHRRAARGSARRSAESLAIALDRHAAADGEPPLPPDAAGSSEVLFPSPDGEAGGE